jgi:hypothetical protein
MELGWSTLVLICLAAGIVWFWQDSLRAREHANRAAMEACERLGLQFLDGTAAFSGLRFARARGALNLRRTYVFDYTANSIERRQGFVILLGHRIEAVGYERGEEDRRQSTANVQVTVVRPPVDAANVLHLEDWRARHKKPPQDHTAAKLDRQDRNPGS